MLKKTILIGWWMMAVSAYSQGIEGDCLGTLSHAEQEFAAGRFFGVPALLKDCIDRNRFTNEEKVRVYMLLTQVYLLTDAPEKAEESYLSLLAANPEFVASETIDPIDVVYLSKKFTTTPIFTPHVKAGVNMTQLALIHEQAAFSRDTYNNVIRTDKMRAGWTLGGGIEWNVTDNVGIGAEGLLSYKQFSTFFSGIFTHDILEKTEKQTWLDLPVYVRYGVSSGRIRPYGYAGIAVNLLLGSRLAQKLTNVTPAIGDQDDASSDSEAPDQDIRFKRQVFNYSIVAGGGLKIKWGKDFILVDARFMPGFTNIVNQKTVFSGDRSRTTFDENISTHGNVSDLFRMNNYAISVGYVKPLYNPRKVKKARTKSVSRKLSKQIDENE